jgi:acyl-CoA reductase-like NAD-dependent aldehyde dehydrogenase
MDDSKGGTTLHAGIAKAYDSATSKTRSNSEVQTLSSTDNEVQSNRVNPWIFRTTASAVLADESLSQETFGPSSMLVTYNSDEELINLIGGLEGQLTGTIQYDDTDLPLSSALISALRNRVGRLILNSYPTGVEVGNAMVHGGPFPATSDGRSTSVGTAAIERFTRAFCYQGFPDASLPDALKNGNPLGIWRTQDGNLTRD